MQRAAIDRLKEFVDKAAKITNRSMLNSGAYRLVPFWELLLVRTTRIAFSHWALVVMQWNICFKTRSSAGPFGRRRGGFEDNRDFVVCPTSNSFWPITRDRLKKSVRGTWARQ
ncbi:MAG: hypothetical protein UZ03_NOB001002890 [Nitrospira sp. OLB3]|nr:MAG: hypothetical protein UZ03_NOB001002890 [Nitrospira sp. OLB3]